MNFSILRHLHRPIRRDAGAGERNVEPFDARLEVHLGWTRAARGGAFGHA